MADRVPASRDPTRLGADRNSQRSSQGREVRIISIRSSDDPLAGDSSGASGPREDGWPPARAGHVGATATSLRGRSVRSRRPPGSAVSKRVFRARRRSCGRRAPIPAVRPRARAGRLPGRERFGLRNAQIAARPQGFGSRRELARCAAPGSSSTVLGRRRVSMHARSWLGSRVAETDRRFGRGDSKGSVGREGENFG